MQYPLHASVTSDEAHITMSSQGAPRGPGGHFQRAIETQGHLSHAWPSWAALSLTEGDLIFGRGMSPVATPVERSTRDPMLVGLPGGHRGELVADALAAAITTLPRQLTRSLTWDQGHEMAEHARFTVDTGVAVYFCDPNSPWQRGSNENINGLLRQYLPRHVSMRDFTQTNLDGIAAELNGRPRQTLGFKTPSEALAEVLR